MDFKKIILTILLPIQIMATNISPIISYLLLDTGASSGSTAVDTRNDGDDGAGDSSSDGDDSADGDDGTNGDGSNDEDDSTDGDSSNDGDDGTDGDSSNGSVEDIITPIGTITDASGIEGLRVVCGAEESFSIANGGFECNQFPMSVFIGTFKLGEVAQLPANKIIYTQDLVSIIHAATTYPEVSKISMILQSLDEDATVENGITLSKESVALLNLYLSYDSVLEDMTYEDIASIIDDVISERLTQDSNSKLKAVDVATAQSNLTSITAQ